VPLYFISIFVLLGQLIKPIHNNLDCQMLMHKILLKGDYDRPVRLIMRVSCHISNNILLSVCHIQFELLQSFTTLFRPNFAFTAIDVNIETRIISMEHSTTEDGVEVVTVQGAIAPQIDRRMFSIMKSLKLFRHHRWK
jgi:hypothetical protein